MPTFTNETYLNRLPDPGDIVEVADHADDHAYRLRVAFVSGHPAGALATGPVITQRGFALDFRTFPLSAGIPYAVIPDPGLKGWLREVFLGRAGRHRAKG